jgi:hypothetical protein
MIALPRKH